MRITKIFSPIVLGGLLIPLVWSRYLNDNYSEPKWFVLRLIAALSVLFLALRRGPIQMPRLSRSLSILLFMWLTVAILNPVVQGTWTWPADIWLDRLALFGLIICFYQFDRAENIFDSIRWPVSIAAVLMCGISAAQFILYRVVEFQPSIRFFAGTFGENNMCAQFLCLALAVTLPYSFKRAQHGRGWFLWSSLTSVFMVAFLFLHHSRSAMIGAALISMFLVLACGRREFVRLVTIAALGFLISVAFQSAQKSGALPTDKSSSTADRKELYLETVAMIRDIPLGVGTGRYEFDSIPFLGSGKFQSGERMLYKSPHSEPLRFLAEEGFIWSIVAFVAMLLVFDARSFFRSLIARERAAIAVAALTLALVPEFLFQFPLENPVPIYFFAVIGASF